MKITGRTSMMPHLSIDEMFKEFKEIGFEGVEVAFVDTQFNFLPNMTEAFYANHVLECSKKYDLPIECVSYHCDYIFDDVKYENMKKAIKAATLYEAKIILFSNGNINWKGDMQKDWNTFIERTKVLVKIAEEVKVALAMEFEPGMVCGCTADLLKMFEEIESDYLKVNCDIGHMFLCDPDPIECIGKLKGKIVHGHVENMQRGVHRHLPPYLGDMDISKYIDKLKEIGFDGALAFDLYGYDYTKEAKKAIPIIKNMF